MSAQTLLLTNELYDYLLSISLREVVTLRELREATSKLSSSQMQIAPEQGQFMAMLVKLMGAKHALEIGVYTGYSSTVVALALPAEGTLLACDTSEEWTAVAKEFWRKANVETKITLKLAPALDTLNELLDLGKQNYFDFVFIDADKGNYDNYYEASLELIRPGGLIVIDNIFRDGDVIDASVTSPATETIRQLNKKLLKDERIELSVIPIGDGLTLARKKN